MKNKNNQSYKFTNYISLVILCSFIFSSAKSQSLSAQVQASAGGYQSNVTGSVSFTIGETNTQTLSNANIMLTQGFQQSFKLILNVKAFLQGYYQNGGSMTNVLYNEGVVGIPNNQTDTITIALHQSTAPYTLAYETQQVIPTNGVIVCNGLGLGGQSYYVVIKHRNTIETWSATPISIGENTTYDFTTSSTQAFGNNLVEMQPNIFAIYSGDINQDGIIDNGDYTPWETDASNFATGYLSSDLNGDGAVDNGDYIFWEMNSNNFVGSMKP